MKSVIGAISLIFAVLLVVSGSPWFDFVNEEEMIIPMLGGENNVFTTEIFHVPLFIKDIRVDVSVKMNSYLRIWCELQIGEQILAFNLNDMSVSYHIEQDRVQLDGKISQQIVNVKATIDTDGIIEGTPELVLTFYTL